MNPWQRKAQERYPHGAFPDVIGGPPGLLPLPTILEHLAYERQECEDCFQGAVHCRDCNASGVTGPELGTCPRCKGAGCWDCPGCQGTGLSPDYRKAQEWAVKLGLEDG